MLRDTRERFDGTLALNSAVLRPLRIDVSDSAEVVDAGSRSGRRGSLMPVLASLRASRPRSALVREAVEVVRDVAEDPPFAHSTRVFCSARAKGTW